MGTAASRDEWQALGFRTPSVPVPSKTLRVCAAALALALLSFKGLSKYVERSRLEIEGPCVHR